MEHIESQKENEVSISVCALSLWLLKNEFPTMPMLGPLYRQNMLEKCSLKLDSLWIPLFKSKSELSLQLNIWILKMFEQIFKHTQRPGIDQCFHEMEVINSVSC